MKPISLSSKIGSEEPLFCNFQTTPKANFEVTSIFLRNEEQIIDTCPILSTSFRSIYPGEFIQWASTSSPECSYFSLHWSSPGEIFSRRILKSI